MCGATRHMLPVSLSKTGLSPRVRGNRGETVLVPKHAGPIPACAGQPTVGRCWARPSGAYPRVCGATGAFKVLNWLGKGLSPRVRGNPFQSVRILQRRGPIPACAGQPDDFIDNAIGMGAYPRVCGATGGLPGTVGGAEGLSPRVRGNLQRDFIIHAVAGPIPACAGQPVRRRIPARECGAYPRVCGATQILINGLCHFAGLSPRVRGNPSAVYSTCTPGGPIPACAGQPRKLLLMCCA